MLSLQEFTYNVKCIISYDGSDYYGFQAQDGYKTVEAELYRAINYITKENNKIIGSGRTDKDVHAKGQVINFYTNLKMDEGRFMYALNRMLPKDIRIVKLTYVNISFHARFSAKKKEYRYLIKFKNYTPFDVRYYHFNDRLNLSLMQEAIKLFEGTHNFEGFCSAEVDKRKDFNKTIYKAEIKVHRDYYEFIFEGTGFLKYQIRRMMAYLIAIGEGREVKEKITEIFKTHQVQMHHRMAPGCGLYLYKVSY